MDESCCFLNKCTQKTWHIGPCGIWQQLALQNENHETATLILIICADGSLLKPTVIFKGKQLQGKDCNKTNPFLPFNDHIFLLYELFRSFWLPYRLPLLSREVRLQFLPKHSWSDNLISWPTPRLLSGDSPCSHLILLINAFLPPFHSNPNNLSDTLRKCQSPFLTPWRTLYFPIHSMHNLFATLLGGRSQFRHTHLVDTLFALFALFMTRYHY